MDKINRSVRESLYNNSYFAEAREWHAIKYILPIVERSYLFLLLLLLSLVILFNAILITSIYHKNAKFLVPIKIDDTIDYQPIIRQIKNNDDDINKAVAKKLVHNYITIRESYSYHQLDNQIQKVKNISTKNVFKQFNKSLELDNPTSPLLLYQTNNKRRIEITSIDDSLEDESFIVKFDAYVEDKEHNIQEKKSWFANVAFSMSDIQYFIKSKQKFYFIVTRYNTQEVK